MANGHGGGGWCAVFIANRSNHRDSSYGAPGWACLSIQPLKSPLVQGGTFIERGAALGGMKNSLENPLRRRGGDGAPGWACSIIQNPPEVPLVQGGTFSSNAAPQYGMTNSFAIRRRGWGRAPVGR